MMNRTEFYIVRHGETAANSRNVVQGQNDVPLNETGLAQAARLAERLKAVHFDAVYASDLSRAMRTARIIAPGPAPGCGVVHCRCLGRPPVRGGRAPLSGRSGGAS